MRTLFLQMKVSLDGFIEDATGEIDWHFADEEFAAFIDATLQSLLAVLSGAASATLEIVRARRYCSRAWLVPGAERSCGEGDYLQPAGDRRE